MCFICVSAGRASGEADGHIEAANASGVNIVRSAAFTGNAEYVDALLQGFSWTGTTGQATTVTYNFNYSTEGGEVLGITQRAVAENAMQAWANVANITFTATSGTADLTFSQEDLGSGIAGLASTSFIGTQMIASEAQIDDSISVLTENSFGYLVLLHEIGHALGLKHPGDYGDGDSEPFLATEDDTIQYTVMSYNNSALVDQEVNAPSTPMVYDIAAMQALYGANTNYESGNTSWSYSGTRVTEAIWDGGGQDTLSAAAYLAAGVTIDLREGEDYTTRIGQAVVQIAYNAVIEQAIGTRNGDGINGNAAANTLYGSNGRDTVAGGSGDDTLYGGDGVADPDDDRDTLGGEAGNDLLYGNTGNDVLYGGGAIADSETGGDTLYGGFGSDSLYGNAGNDSLYGGGALGDPSDGADSIAGGRGADYITGNGGNDFIYGGGGTADPDDAADTLFGGNGNDTLLGNGGADRIDGGPGNDSLHGGVGDDTYVFGDGSGDDTIGLLEGAGTAGGDVIELTANINGSGILTADDAAAAVVFSGSTATLDLGSGNSITIVGLSVTLSADDFTIV